MIVTFGLSLEFVGGVVRSVRAVWRPMTPALGGMLGM